MSTPLMQHLKEVLNDDEAFRRAKQSPMKTSAEIAQAHAELIDTKLRLFINFSGTLPDLTPDILRAAREIVEGSGAESALVMGISIATECQRNFTKRQMEQALAALRAHGVGTEGTG